MSKAFQNTPATPHAACQHDLRALQRALIKSRKKSKNLDWLDEHLYPGITGRTSEGGFRLSWFGLNKPETLNDAINLVRKGKGEEDV